MLIKGTIIKNISNSYVVSAGALKYTCTPRGLFRHSKQTPLVGDHVDIDTETNTITKIYDRTNYLDRPPVANIDYALVITSVKEPNISLALLDRLIVRVLSKNIEPILIFTKCDLLKNSEKKDIKNIMKYYKKLGYKVYKNTELFKLKLVLKNKISFLVGQTGAGKSTFLNKLNKDLNIETKPISTALGRGVHTTRHTEIYVVGKVLLADTPGFSALDISDIDKKDLKNYFVEFKKYNCKFDDCLHLKGECEVIKNSDKDDMFSKRYRNYLKFSRELNENSGKLFK